MDESLARLIAVIYAVFIPSVTGLVAYWMHLRSRRQLTRDHDAALADLQRQIDQLEERVDFAERRLLHPPPTTEPNR